MAYIKNNWELETFQKGDKEILKNLNHMETGIEQGGGSGTTVIANPELVGTEPNLVGLQVGDAKYKIPQGGGATYTAGEGINISTDNVIKNIGVLSVNGNTGTITGLATSTELQAGLATKSTVSVSEQELGTTTIHSITVDGASYKLPLGGGTSYTAGDGITITDNKISVTSNKFVERKDSTPDRLIAYQDNTGLQKEIAVKWDSDKGSLATSEFIATTVGGGEGKITAEKLSDGTTTSTVADVLDGAAKGKTAIQEHQDISGKLDKPTEPVTGQGVNVPYYFDVNYSADKATVKDYTIDLLDKSKAPQQFSIDINAATQTTAGLMSAADKKTVDEMLPAYPTDTESEYVLALKYEDGAWKKYWKETLNKSDVVDSGMVDYMVLKQ